MSSQDIEKTIERMTKDGKAYAVATVVRTMRIARGSHVEPTVDGQWTADLSPVNGPVLGPFRCRSDALVAERQWLEEHWLEQVR